MMPKRKKQCINCKKVFRTHTSISTCIRCQKIRFHVRKIVPDHIPVSQTRKFIDMYMKKHPKGLEEIIKKVRWDN
jgi:hypothetical protein